MFCGLLGYADDTIALCPSREGLQEMMTTCEQYAASHNLQFSTNIDPKKSKTKCLAYQFAYQQGCSTTMCSWLALETISYFMRNNSEVFVCLMDMTKAFDLVRHSLLFRKLLEKGLPAIVIRILFFMYTVQKTNVKWGDKTSNYFSITNGVKQGGVLSAILYCFYMNGLFQLLRKKKVGCWIQGMFCGLWRVC